MGKKKTKRSTNGKRNKGGGRSKNLDGSYHNFVSEAGPGCYIARRDARKLPSWLIEWEDVDPGDFGDQEDIPDVAIDTEERTLSICNIEKCSKVAYVTVFDTPAVGADEIPLELGSTTDNQGNTNSCITFIVLVPPRVFVHLCYLEIPEEIKDITTLRIESDVSPWQQHPNPSDEHSIRIGFPLGKIPPSSMDRTSDAENATVLPSFLCTQGEGGELTHFFSGNLHAIDFQCPIGTELLAVADGVVVDVNDNNTLSGIAVTNLYEWNSILLHICKEKKDDLSPGHDTVDNVPEHSDGPLFVEYVHIQKALVQKGETVSKGQVIGYSGSVGFSPEPHLHFSAFRSSEPTAPTVRVLFDGKAMVTSDATITGVPFLPVAGQCYNAYGVVR
jgi:Peptidase family M23